MLFAAEETPLPTPDYHDPGGILGYAFVVAITMLAAYGARKISTMGKRNGSEPVEPVQQVTVPTLTGTESHTVRSDDQGLTAAISTMAKTVAAMQDRLAAQSASLERVRAEREQIEDRREAAEAYTVTLTEHIEDMIEGHQDARYPPWPKMPARPTWPPGD